LAKQTLWRPEQRWIAAGFVLGRPNTSNGAPRVLASAATSGSPATEARSAKPSYRFTR